MRKNLCAMSILGLFWVAMYLGGCSTNHGTTGNNKTVAPPTRTTDSSGVIPGQTIPGAPVSRTIPPTGDTIKIASFNIQVFGTSKLHKPQVMDILAKTIRRFDVVAIQEVRSTDDTVLPKFVQLINADGSHYDFVIGPRLGRTNSKEQYAFVFNTATIEVDRGSVYTVPDPNDRLHREPLVAHFRVRGLDPQHAFSFRLVDIHTDPDETKTELDALADFFVSVQNHEPREDDVILLGDLNVDEHHLGKLGQLPGITHAISGIPTNTRQTKTYDNIIFIQHATSEYTGRSGVFNLMTEFGLTQAQALEVSDHMPIWAEFSKFESGSGGVPARLTSRTGP